MEISNKVKNIIEKKYTALNGNDQQTKTKVNILLDLIVHLLAIITKLAHKGITITLRT